MKTLPVLLTKLFPNKPNTILSTIYNDLSDFYPLTGFYDIIKMDEYLKKVYKDYGEDISMKDFILKKFGQEILDDFKEVFKIDVSPISE